MKIITFLSLLISSAFGIDNNIPLELTFPPKSAFPLTDMRYAHTVLLNSFYDQVKNHFEGREDFIADLNVGPQQNLVVKKEDAVQVQGETILVAQKALKGHLELEDQLSSLYSKDQLSSLYNEAHSASIGNFGSMTTMFTEVTNDILIALIDQTLQKKDTQ